VSRDDQTLCGWRAVLAAIDQRPDALRKLYYDPARLPALRPILRELAARRVPYREVAAEELERISHSHAHQGVVAILALPPLPLTTEATLQAWATQPGVDLVLDGVDNPHNLGAMARTAAFLGVRALLLGEHGAAAIRSAAANRTAEGGLEHLPVWRSGDLVQDILRFQALGGHAVALAVRGAVPLRAFRSRPGQSLWLVAGSEEAGLRPEVERVCHKKVRIEGTGKVESLNVGVAVAIALARLL
jgi:TrmH RNA methyltransferase